MTTNTNTLGISSDGHYYGIEGQAHAIRNATWILDARNEKVWRGRQVFAFEARGDKMLITGCWDNGVALCTLESKEVARQWWKRLIARGAIRRG